MRQLISCIVFFAPWISIIGQGVYIGQDESDPVPSALLEISSTGSGFLPPRMTVDQMLAISNPAGGLMVYNTSQQIPMVYNGTAWTDLTGGSLYDNLEVGDEYQGGIIFYLDGSGGGLIAGTTDLDVGGNYIVSWGCEGLLLGATSLSDGATNTATILAGCPTQDIAADLCDDYENSGYTDWYLPAKEQLDQMYLLESVIGGFSTSDIYFSSSELTANTVYIVDFGNGNAVPGWKDTVGARVRPIRTF